MATKVVVALDWTPNTNHAGFYAARANGYYDEVGLDVSLLSVTDPVYQGSYTDREGESEEYATPCGLVARGKAHFAINSPEGVVNWNTRPASDSRPKLKAVAAICQRNTSAIACRPEITRPRDLDGKRYASYAARFEGRIVQRLLQADGGSGDYEEVVQPMLGLWNTVLCDRDQAGATDATWIFTCWEGVEAERKGAKLSLFPLEDYGIPYGYAPCLLALPATLAAEPEMARRFLGATARGFEWAAANGREAAEILVRDGIGPDSPYDADFCAQSMAKLGPTFLDASGKWGRMEKALWDAYLDWLSDAGVLTTYINSRKPEAGVSASLDGLRAGDAGTAIPRSSVDSELLFTNEFFD